jgi:hypothetical protein
MLNADIRKQKSEIGKLTSVLSMARRQFLPLGYWTCYNCHDSQLRVEFLLMRGLDNLISTS